ncbi:cytochrome P450 [Rhizobium halophytocola]|uniref:Cytochrome P450 n=1 Tax=Rhizobium halophytocola TaxID=735519 RepID=A0ABS4E075_9HYPH|nr:cytochrome P450 [Rhizobium halophytocola]MBP1851341.1 cytochrome P450 [Rhizobium halophytocola]
MNHYSRFPAAVLPRVDPASLVDDPHAKLAALRVAHPLVQLGDRQYMALRARDVIEMLTDTRTAQIEGADYVRLNRIPEGATARLLRDLFLFSNGDEHRSKRGLFARAFAYGAMKASQDKIRGVADRIVADLPRGESFDFIDRMAARVPAEMTAAILGLPSTGIRYVAERVYVLSQAISPVYPHAAHAQIDSAAADLFAYVEQQALRRLHGPEGDLLSTLVADWSANTVISFESLVHQIVGIIIGGLDTTRAAFAMLVSLLAQHPQQWAAVKADPGLIPGAVSEGLRYDPSVGSIARFVTEPLEIGGVTLPAGVMLRVSTMSAMRDPDLYENPECFDIRRADHPRLHTVFGLGPHRCIGEMLARLELQESLAALAAAVTTIEVETAPRLTGFGGIRQITPMQVRMR